MEVFSPVSGFGGGLLIGLASSLLLLVNGRVAGISGILGGAITPTTGEHNWRIAFIVGLIGGPFLLSFLPGGAPAMAIESSLPMLAVAGLLVGFGTRLGSGCTSGHGVCGIGRGSKRSIVATIVFMAVAILTVFVLRHLVAS